MLFPWFFIVGADEQLVVERLGRRWVGIDQSPVATRISRKRLELLQGGEARSIRA